MGWILKRLLRVERGWWHYGARTWAIQICGSLIIVATATMAGLGEAQAPDLYRANGPDLLSDLRRNYAQVFLLIALVVPFVETVALALNVFLIRLVTKNFLQTALVSGVMWGLIHGFVISIPSGLGNAWSFFVMTVAFQVVGRASFSLGFAFALCLHIATNASAVLVLGILMLAAPL